MYLFSFVNLFAIFLLLLAQKYSQGMTVVTASKPTLTDIHHIHICKPHTRQSGIKIKFIITNAHFMRLKIPAQLRMFSAAAVYSLNNTIRINKLVEMNMRVYDAHANPPIYQR